MNRADVGIWNHHEDNALFVAVGERLKEARMRACLSMREAAGLAGTTAKELARVERGAAPFWNAVSYSNYLEALDRRKR